MWFGTQKAFNPIAVLGSTWERRTANQSDGAYQAEYMPEGADTTAPHLVVAVSRGAYPHGVQLALLRDHTLAEIRGGRSTGAFSWRDLHTSAGECIYEWVVRDDLVFGDQHELFRLLIEGDALHTASIMFTDRVEADDRINTWLRALAEMPLSKSSTELAPSWRPGPTDAKRAQRAIQAAKDALNSANSCDLATFRERTARAKAELRKHDDPALWAMLRFAFAESTVSLLETGAGAHGDRMAGVAAARSALQVFQLASADELRGRLLPTLARLLAFDAPGEPASSPDLRNAAFVFGDLANGLVASHTKDGRQIEAADPIARHWSALARLAYRTRETPSEDLLISARLSDRALGAAYGPVERAALEGERLKVEAEARQPDDERENLLIAALEAFDYASVLAVNALSGKGIALASPVMTALYSEQYSLQWSISGLDQQTFHKLDRSSKNSDHVFVFLRPLKSSRRFILPNRFNPDDERFLRYPSEPRVLTLEASLHRALFNVVEHSSSLGGPPDVLGMSRLLTKDESWQNGAIMLIDRADLILMCLAETEGVRWEVEHLRESGAYGRTILVMPPENTANDHALAWNDTVAFATTRGITFPPYRQEGAFIVMGEHLQPVETLSFESLWDGSLTAHCAARFAVSPPRWPKNA
jgi:hypothetical protein